MKISSTTDLKKIIRATVREAINEMLAEKFIETAIHEMFNRRGESLKEFSTDANVSGYQEPIARKKKKKNHVRESTSAPTAQQKQQLNESIRKSLGIDAGNPLNELFADTYHNNPAMDEKAAAASNEITEEDMEKIGIMEKDWSRFL